ncbi:MAG: ComEC/Rec2 family competence protein [Candidatus Limivicinus sp.]
MRVLARMAAAFSAAVFAANYLLPLSWLLYGAVFAALLSAGLMLLRRKWLRGISLCLLFFGIGLVYYQWNYVETVSRAQAFDGGTYSVYGELTRYPERYDSYCRLELRLLGEELPRGKAIVYDNNFSGSGLSPGDRVCLTGRVSLADSRYGESYDGYYSRGIYYKVSALGPVTCSGQGAGWRYLPVKLNRLLAERIDLIFPEDCAAFMRALLLGDKSRLYGDEALALAMSQAGLMHTVAVSGMHVAFLVALLHFLLGAGRRSALACMSLLWVFVLVTGASPSAVRAGVMQSLLLMAPMLRRENDPPTSLSLALALILMKNPFAAASVSLQLSFAAMAGICCFSGRIYRWFFTHWEAGEQWIPLRYLVVNLSTSLGVLVFTAPLTALHFGSIPLLAALSNMAALWAVSLCFAGGWIACGLSALPLLGQALAWLCAWLARYIFFVARLISSLPFAVLYTEVRGLGLWLAASYGLFAVCTLFLRKNWLRYGVPTLATVLSLCLLLGCTARDYAKGRETFAVISVGQGLCVAAMAGDSTVLIDCGGMNSPENAGELAGRYLLSRGRNRVDVLILTHLHQDHSNGVAMLMEMLPLRQLVVSAPAEEIPQHILDSAQRHGVELVCIREDSLLCVGEDMQARLYVPKERGGGNESCMAVHLDVGGCKALVTGDSPMPLEQRLLREYQLGPTEILVVGHHGSACASSWQLLTELGGGTAVISVGYNSFGHPAEETLERLALCGYNVYRTDRDGTVEIRIG